MPRMPAGRGYTAGFATVQAPDRVRVPMGPSAGQGLEQIGDTVERIGADMGRREAVQLKNAQDVAAQRAEDQARAAEVQRREDVAEQRRVNGIKAANAGVELELDVGAAREDLDDQLSRGVIKPDAYQSKLREFMGKRTGELRQGLDPAAQVDFDRAAIRPTRMAELGAMKSLREHRKREAVAELDKSGELLLREAVTDLPTALARADALYSREGPYAAQIGIDQAQKQGQDFRERASRVHFAQRATNSQNDPRALAALRREIGANTALDPTQQTALIGQIDSRTSVLENRAIAAGQKAERDRDRAFTSLQTLVDQGLPIASEFLDQTMRTLKGTPQAAAAAALVKGSAETASFGTQSVASMDRQLDEMRAQGLDPNSSKLYQKRMTIRNAAESAYRTDPWRAANERGVIDGVPPLDISNLANLSESLTQRMAQSTVVDMAAGRVVSPLRPTEAEGLADTLQALPVPERTKLLGAMHESIGPDRMRAVAEQMKVKSTALGTAAAAQALGLKTEGGAGVGELVLRGADARKSGLVKDSDIAWKQDEAEVLKALDGAYATPPATQAAVDAVMNVYAGMKADGQTPSVKKAIAAVTGGITTHNGQKIPMPYGWDERRTTRAIAAITPDWIRSQAGNAEAFRAGSGHLLLPEDIAAAIPKAQLRSAGAHRYAIRIGDNLVTANGRPLTIALPEVK